MTEGVGFEDAAAPGISSLHHLKTACHLQNCPWTEGQGEEGVAAGVGESSGRRHVKLINLPLLMTNLTMQRVQAYHQGIGSSRYAAIILNTCRCYQQRKLIK